MTLPQIERLGPVRLVFTDRRGGVSRSPWDTLNLGDHVGDDPQHVAENRLRAANRLGAPQVAVVRADHGSRVHTATHPGTADPGDGLVTTVPGLALLALAADCVAGVVAAPDIDGVGVFHCGWRGVIAGVVEATVAALAELGAAPQDMLARLGPAICSGCYAVAEQVRDQVGAAAPPAAATTEDGRPSLDISAAVVWQLQGTGVASIGPDPRCTAEEPDLFSFRRDGTTGRHGVLAVLGGDP